MDESPLSKLKNITLNKKIIGFLNSEFVSERIFFPRMPTITKDIIKYNKRASSLHKRTDIMKFEVDNNFEDFILVNNLIDSSGLVLISGLFFVNDEELPSILVFHGNGELAESYFYFVKYFLELGVNLAVVDYRGYGMSEGAPNFFTLFNDAPQIYEGFSHYLTDNGFKNEVVVYGRSLGSICASLIGAENYKNTKAIIFDSSFFSLFEVIEHLWPSIKRRLDLIASEIKEDNDEDVYKDLIYFSNEYYIPKIRKPVLIMHGTHDLMIPIKHAEMIFNALPSDITKRLVRVRGAGHSGILFYEDSYFNPMKSFLEDISNKIR
ncbi:MAG: alpha/beta hydrolase [Promethearchaeota archaeon]